MVFRNILKEVREVEPLRYFCRKGRQVLEQVRYMISDAARMVSLEQHVLRYWEDELQLDVPRNEMGHRYYTDENIKELLRIKELRDQGYQLKAIRMYLKKEKRVAQKERRKDSIHRNEEDGFVALTTGQELGLSDLPSDSEISEIEDVTKTEQTIPKKQNKIKLEQFQALMTEIVGQALRENNTIITEHVEERILKEMNYLMQEHYQMEEDHYRKLDEAIRGGFRRRKEDRKALFKSAKK